MVGRLLERILDADPVELSEVAVAAPDDPDTVFAHQRDHVRVGDKVASDDHTPSCGTPNLPESFCLASRADMRKRQQALDVSAGDLWVERVLEDGWVGCDTKVGHDRGPEQVEEVGPGRPLGEEGFRRVVIGARGIRGV